MNGGSSHEFYQLSDQRYQPWKCLCADRIRLYHGIWYCQNAEFRTWWCHYGRCIYYLYNVQYHGTFSCDRCSGSCYRLHPVGNGYWKSSIQAFKKGFFSVSGSDHRNRCQLSAAECSSFDLWCKCQGIYFCSIRSRCEAGRRTDQYYRRDHRYDCYLSDHYGRSDAFYQQDQSRTGNVSSIRG